MFEYRCGRTLAGVLWISFGMLAGSTSAVDSDQKPVATQEAEQKLTRPQYLRVSEQRNQWIALDIASVKFVDPAGVKPSISLVGVCHIADTTYYESLQDLLDEFDVVLFESVMPAGTGGAMGATPRERRESTEAAMGFLASAVNAYRSAHNSLPDAIEDVTSFIAGRNELFGKMVAVAATDAWGRMIQYEREPEFDRYALLCLGADGRPGGEGEDADFTILNPAAVPELSFSRRDDGLQQELAEALGLEFQLNVIDYDQPNFQWSDMAVDRIQRELDQRDVDFEILDSALAGTSLPSKVITVLLRLMRVADAMFDGVIADTFKVMLVEMLGNEMVMEASFEKLGAGFSEVIVEERNQVVVDDVKALLDSQPDAKSIAIFYGAAHMPDMGDRLVEQLGYQPGEQQWLRAIEVDLSRSAVSQAEVARIRTMVRQMLRQMQ